MASPSVTWSMLASSKLKDCDNTTAAWVLQLPCSANSTVCKQKRVLRAPPCILLPTLGPITSNHELESESNAAHSTQPHNAAHSRIAKSQVTTAQRTTTQKQDESQPRCNQSENMHTSKDAPKSSLSSCAPRGTAHMLIAKWTTTPPR